MLLLKSATAHAVTTLLFNWEVVREQNIKAAHAPQPGYE